MIEPGKLFHLESGHQRRKLALTFGALERDIKGIAEKGMEYSFKEIPRSEYIIKLCNVLLKDPKLSDDAALEIQSLINSTPLDELRLCNTARNHLLKIIGTFPAEWDLIIAPHNENGTTGTVLERNFYKGLCIYAEDIRSPFNLGSIFRTAEGLGAEKVYISPFCVDPEHPRAVRSAMGCIETMGYERISLEKLPKSVPIFALETGGTDLNDFIFPKNGICIIGSEELGVSPQALQAATYGTVTIPMKGLKASLNVGVALGILMQKWIDSIKNN
ncbi:MAG: TrmH family RNA methyltransferase [Treponema sp.]|nr:TrmH family RNA methyltransferase [Treponema sp.]